MPLVSKSGDEHLKFDIAAPSDWTFTAGDTIIGNVVRYAPIIASDAKLSLALVGRSRIHPEMRGKYVHTCFLIYQEQKGLFRGPLHHPEGSDTPLDWPFSIQIPDKPDKALIREHSKHTSYLPLNDFSHPGHHTFPGSFYSSQKHLGEHNEGIIEYYLRARLQYIFGGDIKSKDATWPIIMRHPINRNVDLDTLRQISALRYIQSWNLTPTNEILSLRERSKKRLGILETPIFPFRVKVTYPEFIQLDSSRVMAATLEILPEKGKGEETPRVLPTLEVNSIGMVLRSQCFIRKRMKSSVLSVPKDEINERRHDLGLDRLFTSSPIALAANGNRYNTLHFGELFELNLLSTGLVSGRTLLSQSKTTIQPDFISYDIKHSNLVQWKISLTIAGEYHEVQGSGPIKLIAPM